VSATATASPESLGLDRARLDALFERVEREVREGLLPSAQIALARHGRLAAVRSFGRVQRDGGEAPADDSTLYVVYSATKAITSSAAWLLMQDGKLAPDERVADVVPGFGENGKQAVTVEHLLTHTAGFPDAPFVPTEWDDRARRLERFASWRLDWEPGSRFVYHPSSSMWVVAELVERRSAMDFRDFVRTRIAEPLGLRDLHVGLPDSEQGRVARVEHVGEPLSEAELARLGVPPPPETEVTEENLERFNQPAYRAVGVPGGGGIASAAALALFYQALLRDSSPHDGPRVWRAQVLADARRVRTGSLRDPLTGRLAERGLGIVVAGDESRSWRGFGKTNSPLAFGHGGAGGQVAWADPETGISFAYLTNGLDRDFLRLGRRVVGVGSRAAVCAARA
jgi:CubicO group peptidase (beta-lactamase class C family)